MSFGRREPAQLSQPSSDDDQPQVDVASIIQKSKIESKQKLSIQQKNHSQLEQASEEVTQTEEQQKQLDEIELEMLVQQCEELISKISPNINSLYIADDTTTLMSDADQSFSMKKQKSRLEKEYIQLCLEIQRQQKELQNYRFKVQVAQKEAEYYGRQIKQKTAILENLEQHSKKGRQSFGKR